MLYCIAGVNSPAIVYLVQYMYLLVLGGLCWHNFEHNGSQMNVSTLQRNGSG